ncbi:hypothetical protein PENSPDRAFT_77650 [Peniophora sp. CONT]|nr:hypothetical protein PENSPDRAFT_77650 [Peniophora sp. CONT]
MSLVTVQILTSPGLLGTLQTHCQIRFEQFTALLISMMIGSYWMAARSAKHTIIHVEDACSTFVVYALPVQALEDPSLAMDL